MDWRSFCRIMSIVSRIVFLVVIIAGRWDVAASFVGLAILFALDARNVYRAGVG